MLTHWVTRRLEKRVAQYFTVHSSIRLVAIVGSIGKASTKHAIGTVLSKNYRIRMHDEVEETKLGVLLSILGIDKPLRPNLFTWLKVLRVAHYQIHHPQEVDIIVQEIPATSKGAIIHYKSFLHPTIAVITAVSHESSSVFGSVDELAGELFEVTKFSDTVLVNRDDVESRFAALDASPNIYTYGTDPLAEYHVELIDTAILSGSTITIDTPSWQASDVTVGLIGQQSLRPVAAAVGVASFLGVPAKELVNSLDLLKPLPGRMNPLRGIEHTIVLDDTMSASPADTAGALQTLYQFTSAAQRIAVIGSMSDLGDASEEEHHKIGKLCNGDLLAWVIVVGQSARQFIGPTARRRGCQVKEVNDAIEAAEFVRNVSEPGSIILVKGAAEMYLEETVRLLCDMSEDHKLVRQDPQSRMLKDRIFSRFSDNH